MTRVLRSLLVVLLFTTVAVAPAADPASEPAPAAQVTADTAHTGDHAAPAAADHGAAAVVDEHAGHDAGHGDGHHAGPAGWSVIPFVVLLLCIAICPLAAPHFWHHHYPKVAVGLGLVSGAYYLFGLHDVPTLVHAGFEYFSFISLLFGLFAAAGGIVIDIDKKATPTVNTAILIFGSVIANVIGTTGAAMLLIRPFMRVNQGRLKAYHIVFFIFMVANVGGALTPIGDPPLFLGFLKGIDFFLFLELNFAPWVFGIVCLSIFFFIIDKRNNAGAELDGGGRVPSGKIGIKGSANFVFLALVVGAVFLDPSKVSFLPAVLIEHHKDISFGWGTDIDIAGGVAGFGFVREFIQLSVGFIAFKMAKTENLQANGFNFEPIKEVGYLFIGIFLTMQPALAIINEMASGGSLFGFPLHPTTFYYGTGVLSGVLDNAPTFLSYLAGLEGKAHLTAQQISDSIIAGQFPAGYDAVHGVEAVSELADDLSASAVAAVFWGAFTYIGNGPNFMVKSIADSTVDENGDKVVDCPSFFGYVIKFAVPFLLPMLILTWLLFFSPWQVL